MSTTQTASPRKVTARPVLSESKQGHSSLFLANQRKHAKEKILEDQRLRHLSGFERVGAMVQERTLTIRPQFTDADWTAEMRAQELISRGILEEQSYTGTFPDFESELWNGRVVFSVDELIAAAITFEKQGRATPLKLAANDQSESQATTPRAY